MNVKDDQGRLAFLRSLVGIAFTALAAVIAWGVAQITGRLDVFEARQADVRERLKALEAQLQRHMDIDDQRFDDRNRPK